MHTKEHLKNMLDWYNVGQEDQLRDKLQVNDYLKTIFDKEKMKGLNKLKILKIDKRKLNFMITIHVTLLLHIVDLISILMKKS